MSQWHLTVAETALFVPIGVVLGAAVSYLGARRGAADNLAAQGMSIAALREQEDAKRRADLAREDRDHRRAAYAELGGLLQGIEDNLNYLRSAVVETSVRPSSEWSEAARVWVAFYMQILDAMPDCRRAVVIHGSAELRAAVGAMGTLTRALASPSPFTEAPGHYIHVLTIRDGGIVIGFDEPANGLAVRTALLGNIEIIQSIVRFALARIRYELAPVPAVEPEVPAGVAVQREG